MNFSSEILINRNSPALPGKPLSVKQFREWIKRSEKSGTISLDEAKARLEEIKKTFNSANK